MSAETGCSKRRISLAEARKIALRVLQEAEVNRTLEHPEDQAMTPEEELVALKKRVVKLIGDIHYPATVSGAHPPTHNGMPCELCALYRDCAPKPVDPWETARTAIKGDLASLKAHESEGKG